MSDFYSDPLSEIIALDRYVEQLCEDERSRMGTWERLCSLGLRTRRLYESGVAPVGVVSEKSFRDPPPPPRPPLTQEEQEGKDRSLDKLLAGAKLPPPGPGMSDAAWQRLMKAAPRRDAVDEVARELGRTPRQVQRYLAQLIQGGEAPATWFDGYQYKPDPSAAAALIRQEFAGSVRRRKRKKPEASAWDAFILDLHAQRKQIEARLQKQRQIRRWLEHFGRAHALQWVTQKMPPLDSMEPAAIVIRRFRVEAAELTRKVLPASRYGIKGWMLQIGFYHARVCESEEPVEHVCQMLKISRSTFWREYAHDPSLMKAARDGGDGYFNAFFSGKSPAQIKKAKSVAPLPDSEMPDAPSAWDEQTVHAADGQRKTDCGGWR